MNELISHIQKAFESHKNPAIATGQKKYMKNRFEFIGIQTPLRRKLIRPFINRNALPPKNKSTKLLKKLWDFNEREYQYAGIDIFEKYLNQIAEEDIDLITYLLTHKSWWDTVDPLATKMTGKYFLRFPDKIRHVTNQWIVSGNIWLQRAAVLFQLKYRENTDSELLSGIIHRVKNTDEFFLNKAIGWALREYGKTSPEWVENFVRENDLHPLSKREALKVINKQ